MIKEKSKKKKKKKKISLRLKLTLASILTLGFSCFLSFVLVVYITLTFHQGSYSHGVVLVMCLIACILTIAIGGVALWHSASYVSNPISEISKAAQKVADGDFNIENIPDNNHRGIFLSQFEDEITCMSMNFNKMLKELKQVDYMNKDFISNVSHELNSPLTTLCAYSELLVDGQLSKDEFLEYTTYIYEETQRLSRIIQTMLLMSKLDNFNIVKRKNSYNVDEQIRKTIILLNEKWESKNIFYDLNLDAGIICSDDDMLMQVWMNIIDNAIKYSNENPVITIKTYVEKETLLISIKDQGIGIVEGKQKRIFDKFYQCDESHYKQGIGLGLSIVKRIVEILEGKILYSSIEGQGTMVEIQIPIIMKDK